MKFTILLSTLAANLILSVSTSTGATASVPGSWAEVKLPYRELTALWASNQEKEEPAAPDPIPPVDAIITAAEYELTLATNAAKLSATYRLAKLNEAWTEIPLLGGDARLDSGATNQHTIAWRKDGYALLTRETGQLESHPSFALPGLNAWDDGIRIKPGAAALNRLHITGLPQGLTVRIENLKPSHHSQDEIVYHFPGAGGEFLLTLEEYRPPQPAPPVEPSDWALQSEILARYENGRLHYDCLVYATAQNGSGVELDLYLPRGAGNIEFAGDDNLIGNITTRSAESRKLNLRWATRDIVDRQVELSYSIAQSPVANQWQLLPPALAAPGESLALLAIPRVNGLELAGEHLKRSIESRSLPDWLQSKVGRQEFLTLEATGASTLAVTWLPQIKTAQATVQEADFQTRIVADGSMLVTASCTIGHSDPLNWRLMMPDYDEILSCEVGGKSLRPIDREAAGLEFPLPACAQGESKITFTYVAKTDGFDPVSGRLELELPKTDLFVHALKWQLAIPDKFETTAIEGNVEIASNGSAKPGEIHLAKQLLRQEHPAIELHYQRRGLND